MDNIRTEGQAKRNLFASLAGKITADRQALMSGAISFFLGMCSLIEGVNPFGIAMLSAAGKKLNAFFVGSVLSSVFAGNMAIPVAAVNIVVYIIRRLFEAKKPMSVRSRVVIASLSALFLASIRYILSSRQFYVAAESLIYYATIPLFAVLYMGLNRRDAFLGKGHREAGLLAAAFSMTVVMTGASYGYFSLGIVWATGLTLLAAKKGMAAGCLTGFVCGLGCFDALLLPMLGLCGLTAGLIMNSNRKTAILAGGGVATVFAAVTSELPKFVITDSALWLGAALFLLAEKAGADKLLFDEMNDGVLVDKDCDPRFQRIAESFSSLATVFFNACETASEKTAKLAIPLKQCGNCLGCSVHGLDEDENNLKLSQLLRGERKRMPKHFEELCPNSAKIETAVAESSDITGSAQMKRIAEQYLDFAKIMECVAEREAERTEPLPEKEEQVKAALDEMGLSYDKVAVNGGRRRKLEVIGITPEAVCVTTTNLRYNLSKAVGTMLGDPQFIQIGDVSVMRMETVPAISIEYAQTSGAAGGERVNGDSTSVFESEDARFYALISDGMGSGPAAASSSRLTAIFLEKLLEMGAKKEESIRLLNKLLIAKEGEIFAGVDLAEIDRVTATATLTKAGAAPSLLIRNSTAHLIQSSTPPAGILDDITAEQTKVRLKRGDIILMFSDGVIGSADKIPLWMLTIIESGKYTSPAELAMKINEGAKRAYAMKDDVTTLAIKIV